MKNKQKNNNRNFVIIAAIIMVLALVAGGTYAYWTWRGNVTAINVTTSIGNIGLTLNGGDGTIGSGLAPAACTNATYASKDTVSINFYNETDFPAYVTLTLKLKSFTWNNGSKPTSTQLSNIKYAISNSSSACTPLSGDAYGALTNTAGGTFSGITANNTKGTAQTQDYELFNINFKLPANTGTEASPSSRTYYLYFWIDAAYEGIHAGSTANGSGVIVDPLQGIAFSTSWSAGTITQSAT